MPSRPVGAFDAQIVDPCGLLNELQAAYYGLLAGTNRVHVRYKERETTYGRPDLARMEREIAKLTAMCRPGTFHAITPWKPRPIGTFPMTPRRYF